MAKKLTTEEILAACRAQGAFGSGGSSEAAAAPAPSAAAEPEAPETAAPPSSSASSAPTPGSTADILAAARTQAAGGGAAKPAAGNAPKSTADILAAARTQGSGAAKKPAAAAATPGSTADILAAARAQASGGGAAKAKPAAKASPKGPAKVKKSGGAKTVAEMLAAARQADGTAAEEKQAVVDAAAKPKLPAKKLSDVKRPAGKSAAAKKGAAATRRGFLAGLAPLLTAFNFGWIMLGAATTAFGLGVARFMMPNVLVEPPTKFKIGAPGDYPAGTVSTKWKAQRGIWVVNTEYKGDPMIYALLTICTHLGCTPSWLEGEQKFKCPCHGSGFYKTGINFEGPAPRPLERVGLRLAEDGMLEVDKSIKFQEEMGQWDDAASFYGLA
jgi:cytochrome b6-f complex iron-sulfur subunit